MTLLFLHREVKLAYIPELISVLEGKFKNWNSGFHPSYPLFYWSAVFSYLTYEIFELIYAKLVSWPIVMSAIYHMILTGILINLSEFLQNQNCVRLWAKNITVKENMILWKYKKNGPQIILGFISGIALTPKKIYERIWL